MRRLVGSREFVELVSSIVKYLLLMGGVLVVLLLIMLASVMPVAQVSPKVSDVAMILLLLPLLMDLMLISPNLPLLLLVLIAVPFLLALIVIVRALFPRSLRRHAVRIESSRSERTYTLPTLLAVSIGATIGPSIFVLAPYNVKLHGWLALPGVMLASTTSVLLAYGYSKMFNYVKTLGGNAIGGPSFVRSAFGARHYLYIASRFTMWIGNVSLAAFNMLVIIELVSSYILPILMSPYSSTLIPIVKVLLFVLLSVMVVALYRVWEKAVELQVYLMLAFLSLFAIHALLIVFAYLPKMPSSPILDFKDVTLQSPPSLQLDIASRFVLGTLSSAAYVYMMVFGFQEVQSLGENIRAKRPSDAFKILKAAMVGGSALAAVIFCLYTMLYMMMEVRGVEIPETVIPALDMASISPSLYIVTSLAILLGVVTTYVPAFVAALKHLRELISDVLLVEVEKFRVSLDPLVVILFMGVLLLTNADYIIRLTDLAVLLSLTAVAISEPRLRRKLIGEKSALSDIRAYLNTLMMISIIASISLTRWEVMVNSILFTLLSTLALMFLSYDLLLVEAFVIAVGVMSLMLVPPLIGVIEALASYGMVSPLSVALEQVLTSSLLMLHFIIFILLAHLTLRYKRLIEAVVQLATALLIEGRALVKRLRKV